MCASTRMTSASRSPLSAPSWDLAVSVVADSSQVAVSDSQRARSHRRSAAAPMGQRSTRSTRPVTSERTSSRLPLGSCRQTGHLDTSPAASMCSRSVVSVSNVRGGRFRATPAGPAGSPHPPPGRGTAWPGRSAPRRSGPAPAAARRLPAVEHRAGEHQRCQDVAVSLRIAGGDHLAYGVADQHDRQRWTRCPNVFDHAVEVVDEGCVVGDQDPLATGVTGG